MRRIVVLSFAASGLLAGVVQAQATTGQPPKAKAQGQGMAKGKGMAKGQGMAKGKGMAGQAKGAMDHKVEGPWKEMNAFHAVLAGTYHPAAEAKNLQPLKLRAKDLATAASAWAASTAPASCSTHAVRTNVSSISTDAASLSNKVNAKAADAELLSAITALHDRFETVEKACGGHGDMKEMKHDMMDMKDMKHEMPGKKDSAAGMKHDMKGMKHDMKDMKKPAPKDTTR